jgi:hypothetical protein
MKTEHVAPGTVENESGSAKYEIRGLDNLDTVVNEILRPRYRQK